MATQQTTPSPSPATVNCGWCGKPMPADAIRCPSCNKLSKAIVNQKILCYVLCGVGGLLIGLGIPKLLKKTNQFDFYNYYGNGGGGSNDHTMGWIMLIAGIVIGGLGTYYWYAISKKIGTYRWW